MITTVVLAAGYARRFGSQKLLAVLPNGLSVIAAALASLSEHSERLLVVTGTDADVRAAVRNLGHREIINSRAEQGMGTSIAAGIAASPGSTGWLIALADMPYVKPNSVAAVKKALTSDGIVVPAFRGKYGHPVGFGSEFGAELATLQGDRGARALLNLHSDCVKVLELPDEGVLQDIDLPSDLR